MAYLKVNEIFGPTVQGEGKNAGRAVMFLRLAFCNLHCIWCDTPHTWNWYGTKWKHQSKFSPEMEIHPFTVEEIINVLYALAKELPPKHLVISGGEPFIQQVKLIPLIKKLKKLNWFVEVETNGTIPVREEFYNLVDQFNCSPKLSNSGNKERLRIQKNTLSDLAKREKFNFKFVIETSQDIEEVIDLHNQFNFREVRLMPLCQTRQELEMRENMVKQLADKFGFIYCTRLSILKSGTKRGV